MSHIAVAVVSILVYWLLNQIKAKRKSDQTLEILLRMAHDLSSGFFEMGYRVGWSSARIEPAATLESGLEKANLEMKFLFAEAAEITKQKMKSAKP